MTDYPPVHKKRFKEQFDEFARTKEALKILTKYPDRVPVIIERSESCRSIPDLDRRKFLVPHELTVGQLLVVVRKRIKLNSAQQIFLFVNNTLPPTGMTMGELYKQHKDTCGYLFMTLCAENAFGATK